MDVVAEVEEAEGFTVASDLTEVMRAEDSVECRIVSEDDVASLELSRRMDSEVEEVFSMVTVAEDLVTEW